MASPPPPPPPSLRFPSLLVSCKWPTKSEPKIKMKKIAGVGQVPRKVQQISRKIHQESVFSILLPEISLWGIKKNYPKNTFSAANTSKKTWPQKIDSIYLDLLYFSSYEQLFKITLWRRRHQTYFFFPNFNMREYLFHNTYRYLQNQGEFAEHFFWS